MQIDLTSTEICAFPRDDKDQQLFAKVMHKITQSHRISGDQVFRHLSACRCGHQSFCTLNFEIIAF